MKPLIPTIRKVTWGNLGNRRPWLLQGLKLKDRPVRLFFSTRRAAEIKLAELQAQAKKHGEDAEALTAAQRVDAVQAIELLQPHGKSLADAAKFLADYLARASASCTVDELVRELLAAKRADGRSKRYTNDLACRLGRFSRDPDAGEIAFGERKVSTITTAEIDRWLRALTLAPVSRNNFRRCLGVLFGFALPRKYCISNPVSATEEAKVTAGEPGILTPIQFERLLNAADERLRPALAIGGFAGLRPAELQRIIWDDVNLEERWIKVSAMNSKTASKRLVPIADNLLAWLMRAPKRSGAVCDALHGRLTLEARAAAGIKEWPVDALRHSFCTYRYALTGEAARTASEAGHDQAVLHKHYRALATKAQAEAYFAIVPGAQNAVPIPFDQAAQA